MDFRIREPEGSGRLVADLRAHDDGEARHKRVGEVGDAGATFRSHRCPPRRPHEITLKELLIFLVEEHEKRRSFVSNP